MFLLASGNLKKQNKYRSDRKVYFSFFPAPTSIPGGGKA
jgi:hypothetical protein